MKKSIMTLAALAALLAVQELDATKEGAVLMDDDTLKKINDALAAKQTEIDNLKSQKEAAENAKQKAEAEKAAAIEAKQTAEARAQELKNFLDKIPAAPTSVIGPDVKDEKPSDSWEDSESYKRACQELGVEA